MRFGTTTVPIAGWLADSSHPEESRTRQLAAVRTLVEGYGLAAVEVNPELSTLFPQIFDSDFYAALGQLQRELGFVCTVHLPFLWLDCSSLNEAVRQVSVDHIGRSIQLVRSLEVVTYVLHLWGFTTMRISGEFHDPQRVLPAIQTQARRSLVQFSKMVEPRSLCVENLESPAFAHFAPLVEELGLSICLDVGHLAWQGGDELGFLTQYGDRIREVHLHDALRTAVEGVSQVRDHLALGHGQIDYVSFLEALHDRGYDGTVIIEVNAREDLEESLTRLQPFLARSAVPKH